MLTRRKHLLHYSTAYNTAATCYVRNNKKLFVLGLIRPAKENEVLEVGTSSLPIIRQGKRVIKNVLTTKEGEKTGDLRLSRIAFVPDFHINIISKATLLKGEVQYYGSFCALYYKLKNPTKIA